MTRPPFVYRGNPFQVEVGLFYGKALKSDALMQVYRYANRVPLQYQASACAMTKAAMNPKKSFDTGFPASERGPIRRMNYRLQPRNVKQGTLGTGLQRWRNDYDRT